MRNLVQLNDQQFIRVDLLESFDLESFNEKFLELLISKFSLNQRPKYKYLFEYLTQVDDFEVYLLGLSGIYRELSYYLEKDDSFLKLLFSLAKYFLSQKRNLDCFNLFVETIGLNSLTYIFLKDIYFETIHQKETYQSYEIALTFYNRVSSFSFGDKELERNKVAWEGAVTGAIFVLVKMFLKKTESLTDDDFVSLAEESRILINMFRNNPVTNFDILKKARIIISEDIVEVQLMPIFIKRLVDITFAFRERIFEEGETLDNYFWNVITKYGSYPMAETKYEHIKYVAAYLGLTFNDIAYLFSDDKKKEP